MQSLLIVAPGGEFWGLEHNLTTDCAQLSSGTLKGTATTLSGSAVVSSATYASGTNLKTNCQYADGATWGHVTYSGSFTPQSVLQLTQTVKTSKGTVLPSMSDTLTFSKVYDEPSSLAKLVGNWTGVSGAVTTIYSDGTTFSQDPGTGCVVNGRYSIIDSKHNIYATAATFSGCKGAEAVLNGQTPSGLAVLDDSGNPIRIVGGLSVKLKSGATVIVIGTVSR